MRLGEIVLATQGQIRQSVGRVGSSADNAVAESFWASLKRELIDRHRWASRAPVRRAIFAWINRDIRHRLHTSLAMVPPVHWEHAYAQQLAGAPLSGQRGDGRQVGVAGAGS